jgi:hypothetical protein
MLRNQALDAKLAGLSKEVRSDLALLKGTEENPLQPAGEEPGKIGLSVAGLPFGHEVHGNRQSPDLGCL